MSEKTRGIILFFSNKGILYYEIQWNIFKSYLWKVSPSVSKWPK